MANNLSSFCNTKRACFEGVNEHMAKGKMTD